MADTDRSFVIFFLLFSATFLFALGDAKKPDVPAIYVFGDSTADVGNNNYLNSRSTKADYPHYGIDFPGKRATGRFSNAYNGIDFIAAHMGFRRSPPPYLSLQNKTNHHIHRGYVGINFASAGSGILSSTGSAITMENQIKMFASFQSNLTKTVGAKQTDALLSKSIFLISSGGNDIFAFASSDPSANNTEVSKFIVDLTSNYSQHLLTLYNLGARKFAVINVPPIGCCPYARTLSPTGDCISSLNELTLAFNKATNELLQKLSSKYAGMLKYSIGSSYNVVSNIVTNPQPLGFKEVKQACCGTGRFNAETLCIPNSTYCEDRGKYLFWDQLHPTHATSKIAAAAFFRGSQEYAAPISFKQLVHGV